ncbi:peptidase family C50-domain-containing protein [Whalleya microplaca]|nr:peptidase family C50-domain-containing protein [Whalleya microplaca]
MDSLLAQADAVRTAVASVSTTTPIISATLKELLQCKDIDNQPSKPAPKSRPGKAPAPSRARASTTTKQRRAPNTTSTGDNTGSLAAKEKAILATQVINATLKALGEAAKAPPVSNKSTREPSKDEVTKPAGRKALRRSNSMPMTPLQPRSLNRVSTSPAMTRICRSPTISPSTSCLATVECTRAAFSTLRTLQASGSVQLPELQLESGMSSFVSKLIALNLFDQATRELRILKRRLVLMTSGGDAKKATTTAGPESTAPARLSDLLDFANVTASGPLLNLVITAQLQALRIFHGLKKSSQLGSFLPFLRMNCSSSPQNLLLLSLEDGKPDRTKCSRQLEGLSQSLLSLTPSLSAKDDGIAVEPRLSPSPETSLEIQALGLAIKLHSWRISGHKGNVDQDILLPLSKCLATFTRRSSSVNYHSVASAFSQVWECIEKLRLIPSESSRSSLAEIYQVLAATARESGNIDEARKWTAKLRSFINPKEDSAAKCCAVTAQLVALSLKQSPEVDESLLTEVLDGLQGALSGNMTELDDLLISVCFLRKSAMGCVTKEGNSSTSVSQGLRQLLRTFIFQLPRFSLRWLGKPPASSNATKDFLRFEQRRQLLSKYLPHILDSALMLAKLLLDDDKLAWDEMDAMLQDCLTILENIGDSFRSANKDSALSSYHVKISHFYYQQHLTLRKSASKATETTSLRALRRSIDSVKHRPEPEQVQASLFIKWERFAELCRTSGRRDDAIDALRSIRDHLVRQEIVSAITTSLATTPLLEAWKRPDAEMLSRTVCNIAKLEQKPVDWTWLVVGPDKATALEHDFYFVISNDSKYRRELDLADPTIQSLLQHYSVEQFPIRRLRTLLQLLTINMSAQDGIVNLRSEVEAVLANITKASLGEDSGLARYVPHLKALAACLFGLVDSGLDSTRIQKALSGWKRIISSSRSSEQLLGHIDNPTQLLTNLQSLADFARMKGQEALRTDVLELSTDLSKLVAGSNLELQLTQSIALCLQHLSLGWSSKAEKTLQDSQQLISRSDINDEIIINFHLSAAEYYLAIGTFDKAEQHLGDAHNIVTISSKEQPPRKNKSSNRKASIAYASFLCSRLALERGDSHHALHLAKTAVKILFHDWSKLEEMRCSSNDVSTEELSQTETSANDMSLSSSRMGRSDFARANTGPEFWGLVYPLFRFILRLSSTYAHIGMYQETLYYAEQAQKVAQSMESPAYTSRATAWLASVWSTAGKLKQAIELANEVKPTLFSLEPSYQSVKVLCQLSSVYRDSQDAVAQVELMGKAESMLRDLNGNKLDGNEPPEKTLESGMAKLSVKESSIPKPRVRRTVAAKTTRGASKTISKKPVAVRAKSPVEVQSNITAEETQLSFLRTSILQCQSTRLLDEKDWIAAVSALRAILESSMLSTDMSQSHFLIGIALVGQSLEQMGRDSIFSVIQDSTLSFPSIAAPSKDKNASDRSPLAKTTPPRKGRVSPQAVQSFIESLREAQDHLLQAHSIASLNGNGSLVHRIATVMQNVLIILSTANSSRSVAAHPAHATCSIELARNLTWRRERKALHLEASKDLKLDWPVLKSLEPRRASLGFSIDMNRFQRDYVDIIPASWNVVSVSLSDGEHDLCITKLQAGHSPFAIRLPLERATSRDADSEVFSFRQGRSELLDIIESANRTCHDARDMSQKEAKSAWWAEREELDERLKDLLENIEHTWLGGFKGIFAQPYRRSDLLARFQKSFQNILDKHLPSRRQVRGRRTKTAPPKVNLDPRILDLFIGLGDATAPQCDLDEPLMDLLYFVVDILQFHGERNAYDEIEFDAMVVDTFDALHSYHAAAKSNKDEDRDSHTILILDKPLHIFPWESLPCLQGSAVSRVPSLACLRRSIQEARSAHSKSTNGDKDELLNDPSPREGHYASIRSGTYILNPSGDLKNTQATFSKPLSSLPSASWTSIATRAPSEAEFEGALTGADLLLYFGHGSGAQYIRGRTIRKLEKCRAVALLMGCSSASLADVGQFECHGTVWNYMLAGSPAVVGTLWDVTDRDIDRFAGRVFEEWGLLPRGTFAEDSAMGKGKGKGGKAAAKSGKGARRKVVVDDDASSGSGSEGAGGDGQTSLVEAVARARDACRFRYLTAASVCVYGIPVYIGD